MFDMSRSTARAMGELTYTGKACERCQEDRRYVSSGGCVACMTSTTPEKQRLLYKAREARELATLSGAKRFQGTECKRCGNYERFTSNNGCVVCCVGKSTAARLAQRAKYHSEDSLLVWVPLPPEPHIAPLYAMCPTLAAHNGAWHVAYSDAGHLTRSTMRLLTGRDVLERPQVLTMIANEALKGGSEPHHEIVRHLFPAINASMRAYNLSLGGRGHV